MPPNTSDTLSLGQLEAAVIADGKTAYIFPVARFGEAGRVVSHEGKNYCFVGGDNWRCDHNFLRSQIRQHQDAIEQLQQALKFLGYLSF